MISILILHLLLAIFSIFRQIYKLESELSELVSPNPFWFCTVGPNRINKTPQPSQLSFPIFAQEFEYTSEVPTDVYFLLIANYIIPSTL